MEYLIAGLVLGGIYTIAAAGLVITFTSAGILNFAFGAEMYFIVRLYYFLDIQQHWGILPSALFCLLFASPAMGATLYLVLFRFLRLVSPVIKVVATIGLAVSIPPIASICFGNDAIFSAPGLAPEPVSIFHLGGVAISLDQVNVLLATVVLAVVGMAIIRITSVGLAMRSMVDSPALTSLAGTSPTRVSLGVWTAITFVVGLIGVLVAPIVGISTPDGFTLLMAAAFAAVIAAKLRSVGIAVGVGVLLGVAGGVVEWLVPANSTWGASALTAIPFAVTAIFLLFYILRGDARDSAPAGGLLDRAIAFEGAGRAGHRGASQSQIVLSPSESRLKRTLLGPNAGGLIIMGLIALLPLVLHGYWVGYVGLSLAYGIALLSYTVITGEGGMISLCQITFAAIGGMTTALFAVNAHWPVLAAMVVGGFVAGLVGVAIGMLSVKLGDLYLALVTLTFGVLMDNLVFTLNVFSNDGAGITLHRPGFLAGDRAFSYFAIGIFCALSIVVTNLRRSTTGLAAAAVRSSETASRTSGISVIQVKVLLTALSSFIAGIGGAMLALYDNNANPANFVTLSGLVWLAVVVTIGIRSNAAAALAGLGLAFIPALFASYLPPSVTQIPIAMFGLGAILVTRNPDGTFAMHARQLKWLIARTVLHDRLAPESTSVTSRRDDTDTQYQEPFRVRVGSARRGEPQ